MIKKLLFCILFFVNNNFAAVSILDVLRENLTQSHQFRRILKLSLFTFLVNYTMPKLIKSIFGRKNLSNEEKYGLLNKYFAIQEDKSKDVEKKNIIR